VEVVVALRLFTLVGMPSHMTMPYRGGVGTCLLIRIRRLHALQATDDPWPSPGSPASKSNWESRHSAEAIHL